jgi:hypothetical protein
MTSLFLDHLLLFSGTLVVLLVIAVESGFRLLVLSAANSELKILTRPLPMFRAAAGDDHGCGR